MPIDVARVAGAELEPISGSWTPDDVILYQLGLGAQELDYAFERDLKVLPSYGVIPASAMLWRMLELPGMDVDLAKILHGEQELELHEPLPAKAEVVTRARVTAVADKGSAALVVLETRTHAAADDRPLVTNRFSAFVRGEGGFGGNGGPQPAPAPPARGPDLVVERPTARAQALLYRLSGDKNPIHADPEFARRGGFDRPILHGLCSYGIACKAVVDEALGGDVTRVAGYRARFAGVVFPGETLVVKLWRGDDAVALGVSTKERDTPVLTNAVVTLRPPA